MAEGGELKLGSSVNLLKGFNANWKPAGNTGLPFIPAHNNAFALRDLQNTPPDVSAKWIFQVSLTRTVEELLAGLYGYNVVHFGRAVRETRGIDATAGILAAEPGRTEKLTQIGRHIGVDLLRAAGGYALVTLKWVSRTEEHPAANAQTHADAGVTDAFKAALSKVPMEDDEHAGNTLIKFMDDYGSYFVGSVTTGDVIYQVFSYDQAKFTEVLSQFPKGSAEDYDAMPFIYYTSKVVYFPEGDSTGYTQEIGKLLCFSENPAFAASVQAKHWEDTMYTQKDNICHYFRNRTNINPVLNTKMKETAIPIEIGLVNLSAFLLTNQRIWWYRNLKSAAVARFSGRVDPHLRATAIPADLADTYHAPTALVPLSSYIATPRIDLYYEKIALEDLQQLRQPNAVKSFMLLANVITLAGESRHVIPGDQVVIIAQALVSFSQGEKVPEIVVSDRAFEQQCFYFKSIFGAVQFVSASGKKRLVCNNSHVAYTHDDKETEVRTTHLSSGPLPAGLLSDKTTGTLSVADRLANLVNLAVGQASWILTRASIKGITTSLVADFLDWLVNLSKDTTNDELALADTLALQLRMQLQLDPTFASRYVPYLKYDQYRPQIEALEKQAEAYLAQVKLSQQQIENQKQKELQYDIGNTVNQNIKHTGDVIVKVAKANAAKEKDLIGEYNRLMKVTNGDIANLNSDIDKITKKLDTQKKAVETAQDNYKAALRAWQANQYMKAIFEITGAVLSIGFAFVTPSTAAFEAIGKVQKFAEMWQKLSKFAAVLDSINKLRDAVANNVTSLIKSHSSIANIKTEAPSEMEWDEFQIDFSQSISAAPDELPEKAQLQREVDLLILYGKALLTAVDKKEQLARDVDTYNANISISQKQAQRLEEAANSLAHDELRPLDLEKIDLLGIASQMAFQYTAACAHLAKVVYTQRQALKYEFMISNPPPFQEGFELTNLLSMIAQQESMAVDAKTRLNPPPRPWVTPITILADVPKEKLALGKEHTIKIDLTSDEFRRYVMVRLDKVQVRVKGLKKAPENKTRSYILSVTYHGEGMMDRGLDREILQFSTISRRWNFLYNLDTGEAEYGSDKGSLDDQLSRITPFSQWTVSLPKTETNTGLETEGEDLFVEFSFGGEALLNDPVTASRMMRMNAPPMAVHANIPHAPRMALAAAAPMMEMAAAPAANAPWTEDDVKAHMRGNRVMSDWDVVVVLDRNKTNEIMLQQYQDPNNQKVPRSISGSYTIPDSEVTQKMSVEATLSAAKIAFRAYEDYTLKIEIPVKSGTFTRSYIDTATGEELKPGKPQPFPADAVLTADVKTSMASIVMDRSTKYDFTLVLDGALWKVTNGDAMLNMTITNCFAGKEFTYLLHSIDRARAEADSIPQLLPKFARPRSRDTASGRNIIEIFIGTERDNSRAGPSASAAFNIPEPLPTGVDVAMYIDGDIILGNVLQKGFTTVTEGGWDMRFSPHGGQETFGNLTCISKNIVLGIRSDQIRAPDGTQNITKNLAGMKIAMEKDKNLSVISYSSTWNQDFQFKYVRYVANGPYAPPSRYESWERTTLPISLTFSSELPIQVQANDASTMTVQIDVNGMAINPSTTVGDPPGACECEMDLTPYKKKFSEAVKAELPAVLRSALGNVRFQGVSVLALKSILFPAHYMKFERAWMPGDMALFGKLEDKPVAHA